MGRSIALTLARDGADMALNYHRNDERVAETAAPSRDGPAGAAVAADIADPAEVEAMVDATPRTSSGRSISSSTAPAGHGSRRTSRRSTRRTSAR